LLLAKKFAYAVLQAWHCLIVHDMDTNPRSVSKGNDVTECVRV